jgi:hypothetical protein
MGWSDQQADPNAIAQGLQSFFGALAGGVRAHDNVGPVLWFDLRDNSSLTTRDDQLGLRRTAPDGSDAGPKPVWSVFAAAAAAQGTIALPPALSDSGSYHAAQAAQPRASVASTTSSTRSHSAARHARARAGASNKRPRNV